MNILITGATGFIGTKLCRTLALQGDRVTALSRDANRAKNQIPELSEAYDWNPESEPAPREAFEGVEAVIHLLGESVVGRWTLAKKTAIHKSRVVSTRNLVATLGSLNSRPHALISASAIGYYGDRMDEKLTEDSSPGSDFLASVSQEWEMEACKAEDYGINVSRLRIGIVLALGGGALGAMLPSFRFGLGGPLGLGRQWWSWIHRDDLIGLVNHLLKNNYKGAVNAVAPSPVRQKQFARVLGGVLSRPALLPAPVFALKLVLGGFASELLSSKLVLPTVAEQSGYTFRYPNLENALSDLLNQ
jgi:uncharacterized protein (TIGR01777 family)